MPPLRRALLNAVDELRTPGLDHDVRQAADLLRLLLLVRDDDPIEANRLVAGLRPAVDQIIAAAEARVVAMRQDHSLVRPSLDFTMRVVLHLQSRCGVDLGVDTRTWPPESSSARNETAESADELVSASLAAIARYCLKSDARCEPEPTAAERDQALISQSVVVSPDRPRQ